MHGAEHGTSSEHMRLDVHRCKHNTRLKAHEDSALEKQQATTIAREFKFKLYITQPPPPP
jgi:hypothetical protein